MSYDFFFTHPYQSLKIDSSDDIQTTILLLAIGLLVAEIVAFSRRHRLTSEHRGDEIARAPPGRRAGGLRHRRRRRACCRSRPSSSGCSRCVSAASRRRRSRRAPVLERNGAIAGDHRRWIGGEYTLPAEGVADPRARTWARRSAASCSSPTCRSVCRSRSASWRSRSPTSSAPRSRRTRRTPPDAAQSTPASTNPAVAASRPSDDASHRVHHRGATRRPVSSRPKVSYENDENVV